MDFIKPINEQLEVALELLEKEDVHVAFLCASHMVHQLVRKLKNLKGTYEPTRLRYTAPNGSTLRFQNIGTYSDAITVFSGVQLTHVIINITATYEKAALDFVKSRIRSAKYKGLLGVYYENGRFEGSY